MKEGAILSWKEVSQIHKTRHGIYQKNGRLISLLTDLGQINLCYPDRYVDSDNVIFYTGAGRRGNQKLDRFNQALLSMIGSNTSVPLFCKLKTNQWKFLGFWKVESGEYVFDEKQNRMIWRFKLKKTS